jgi:hypothetical protein
MGSIVLPNDFVMMQIGKSGEEGEDLDGDDISVESGDEGERLLEKELMREEEEVRTRKMI